VWSECSCVMSTALSLSKSNLIDTRSRSSPSPASTNMLALSSWPRSICVAIEDSEYSTCAVIKALGTEEFKIHLSLFAPRTVPAVDFSPAPPLGASNRRRRHYQNRYWLASLFEERGSSQSCRGFLGGGSLKSWPRRHHRWHSVAALTFASLSSAFPKQPVSSLAQGGYAPNNPI